jgi:predicted transcriptional regulator
MKQLTRAQEDLMHYVWELGECTVGQLRESIRAKTGKLPAHSTVSTLIRALDERGFVSHRSYGRTFVYTPAIGREAYGRQGLHRLVSRFFSGSAGAAVSYLVKDESISLEEIGDLLRQLEEE